MLDVLGSAHADATVTVTFPASGGTIYATTRQDELYFKQLSVTNTSAAQYPALKVTAVLNDAGPNGEDVIAEETRNAFVAQTPETYGHDTDGNLTADSRWTYDWDAENRLVAMETTAASVTVGVARRKLEFAYDGQSRRVAKKVYSWTGSAWALDGHTLYVYDGWNMIAELDALASNAAIRTYVWGLDLSGTLQGAGGVGGLLFSNALLPSASSHAPAYDGNGNVIAYVDMATGAKSATYEYSAFGETLIADGVAHEVMPFRFSTKYTDNESGLLYYGHRYYSSSTGRWLTKDSIGERGGVNLYAFVNNRPVSSVDIHGKVEYAVGVGLSVTGVAAPGFHVTLEISKTDHVITSPEFSFKTCINASLIVGITGGAFVGAGVEIPIGFSPDNSLEGPAVSTGGAAGVGGLGEPFEGSVSVAKNDFSGNITAAGSGPGFGVGVGAYVGPIKVFSGTSCYTGLCSRLPGVRQYNDAKHATLAVAQVKEAFKIWQRGRP